METYNQSLDLIQHNGMEVIFMVYAKINTDFYSNNVFPSPSQWPDSLLENRASSCTEILSHLHLIPPPTTNKSQKTSFSSERAVLRPTRF